MLAYLSNIFNILMILNNLQGRMQHIFSMLYILKGQKEV